VTARKLGAIHTPAPPAIRPLAARARLALMTPPQSADWLAACPADGDPLGNDAVGNCVPCAELRTVQVRRANARGDSWRPTRDTAFALYAALTGFNPTTGLPDDGTDTARAMASWTTGGIRIDEQNLDVVCWAAVDPADAAHIAIAIGHTGPVQVTLALPKAAETSPSGRSRQAMARVGNRVPGAVTVSWRGSSTVRSACAAPGARTS